MIGVTRRILGMTFLSSLAMTIFPGLAFAGPPTKCRTLGQTTTYNGKLFTCVKAKSKGKTILAWDSGKIIPTPSPSATQSPTPSPSPSPSPTPTKTPERIIVNKIDIPIAKSSEVPNNSTSSFTAKNRYGNITSYFIVRGPEGLIGMNATCTHSGCTVKQASEGLLCPCHSALFDPNNGAVLRGPASYPLDRVPVREENGTIYLTD